MADNVLITQGTQTSIATDDVSSVQFQKIKLDVGADGVSSAFTGTLGAVTNIAAGTITKVEGGTIGNIASGSVVVTVGTFTNTGTTVGVAVGTQQTLGTVGVLNAGSVVVTVGSVQVSGGTLNVVAGGSHVHTAGTTNVTTGSIVMTAGTAIVTGSVVVTVGTTTVTTGSIVQTAGTITTGSLTNVATLGTIIRTQKSDYRGQNQPTSFGTVGTASGSLFGTISGTSGAGTVHMISGVDIICSSGTPEVLVLIGSAITGGSVLAQGAFAPGGGISKTFSPPIESGTQSELIYHFVSAGTARITVSYWKTV